MLLTLIGLATAGIVGYNAVKDEEHREKTGQFLTKAAHLAEDFTERMAGEVDKQYQRGKIDENAYQKFNDSHQKYQEAKERAEARRNGEYYD